LKYLSDVWVTLTVMSLSLSTTKERSCDGSDNSDG
jgi:hypothetical protein